MLPDVPGLGVEVNEAAFRQATPIETEAPHLSKRDGSHTNW